MFRAIIATVSTKKQNNLPEVGHFSMHGGGTFIINKETGEPLAITADDYVESMKNSDGIVGKVPICPMCYEEVYHVNGNYSKYFSHYPLTENSPECKYRVKYSPSYSEYETRAAVKSLPLLIRFKRVLDYYFSDSATGPLESGRSRIIIELCKRMRENWYDHRLIATAFNFESPEKMYEMFTTLAPFLVKLTPKLNELGLAYLQNEQRKNSIFLWSCLHVPRERTNLEYLLKLTSRFLANHTVILSQERENLEQEIIFWSFGLLSIVPWYITSQLNIF
jgi:hypothetical protein